MSNHFVESVPFPEFNLWEVIKSSKRPISVDLELTARCNNNCRHCYINLPANDAEAKKKELSLWEIKKIIDQCASFGVFWCVLTGGEPLLREDFFEIYLYLKKKGFLIEVFTNATLITDEHISFFKKYPPRDIEVTVYGVTKHTYEQVTRKPGSFAAFIRGINLLFKNNIKVRFKAMAISSNVHELNMIARFYRERTKDFFRFDPFLHLRLDANKERNEEIKSERLTPDQIFMVEQQDNDRARYMKKNCNMYINPELAHFSGNYLFRCALGEKNLTVSNDGYLRICSLLMHPECTYNLKRGKLEQAWEELSLKVRNMRSDNEELLHKCQKCAIVNLCLWCPAYSYLENGKLDKPEEYFCKVAYARLELLK
jgi:radical SAM protein with 4Fe4S-binding SPASM domain